MKSECVLILLGCFLFTQTTSNTEKISKINETVNFVSQNTEIIINIRTRNYRIHRNFCPIEFNVNGEKVRLNLSFSKRKVISPKASIWLVKSKPELPSNYSYENIKNTKSLIEGDFYVDNDNKAVILVRYNHEKRIVLYDGIYGEGIARKRIHSIFDCSFSRSKRTNIIKSNHVISNLPEFDESFDGSTFDNERITIERNGVLLDKLDKPLDTLYPKILLVVDYHLFKSLNKDVGETVKYLATFWNIVDQKYAKFDQPKVQIVVTGIIIASDEKALNYVYHSRNNTEKADIDLMMENTRLYFSQIFFNDTGFKNYDAVIVMTGLKMNLLEGFFDISGLAAKLGGICSHQDNVAIVTDHAANYNTLIAVHELGHLLNLSHDFAEECSGITYLFGKIKTSVMSAPSNGTDVFWSECSLKSLKEFATLKVAECLKYRYRPN